MREIIIPHDPARGPLTAVRRMLVHSSLAELQELGVYDRYCSLIDRVSLERIHELIGPGWMPLPLALKHYEACDRMQLSDEVVLDAGQRAGENMGKSLLVAGAQSTASPTDRSPWPILGAFSRMGRRIYDGGSSQYVKLGPNALQIEHDRNPLFAFHYYRVAHSGFLRKSFGSLGVDVRDVNCSAYRAEKAQIDYRVTWR
jgi:hypothetical protein